MKKTNQLTTIALGCALYVVLSFIIPIRVIGNYFLCFGYAIIVIYPYVYGPMIGSVVGLLGTLIYCVLASSWTGIVGWSLGNCFIGYVLGKTFEKTKGQNKYVIDVLVMIVSCAIGIILIKSLTETIMYQVSIFLRIPNNSIAFLMDVIVMLASYPVAIMLDKHIKR